MLGRLIKACAGVVVFSEEHEIPAWMGALLDGNTDANGLVKGAGHKYLRRVPKAGGGYRYFYNVTGGGGLGHHAEMVAGAAFRVKHAGKEGHFHVTADHGDEVTVKHDESGHEQKMSKAALRAMLHAEHAEALGAVKARASKTLEQARKTGTAKQQERAAALVSKYGGASEKRQTVSVKEINAALKADPVSALKKYGQDMAGRTLRAKLTMVDPDSYSSRTGLKIKTASRDLVVLGGSPEGLRVLIADRKRKDPAPYESSYHYDNLTLPWDDLSLEAPSLDARGEDWREVRNRIKVSAASVHEAPPAHTLGLAAISAATESIRDPKEREALWGAVASPKDAALLASHAGWAVKDALYNLYKHLRDNGTADPYNRPGTARLMASGRPLEQANRDEAATIAELIRTQNPDTASVEAAAQQALALKATPLYLVNTERMQRDILRQQASDARSSSMAKSMSHRMEVVGAEEVELPDWLGEALYSDENGVLIKGAGHKYIRRVPKAGGGWRYFYTVTGGHGLGHHSEMVTGAAFKIKDAGQEGHFHVEEDHGDEVTLRHDETGKTSKVSKKALAGMLHAEHAEAVGKVRARVTANLEQAKKTGTKKQQERAAALVSKYGGVAERMEALPKTPTDIVRQKLHEHSFLVDEIVKQRQNLQKPLIADGEDAWVKYNAKWFDLQEKEQNERNSVKILANELARLTQRR